MRIIKDMEEFKVIVGKEVRLDTGELVIAEHDVYRNEHGILVKFATVWRPKEIHPFEDP